MSLNRLSFLTQLINLFTSTVAYEERLDNFVNLIARNFKVDLTFFFGLDKTRAYSFPQCRQSENWQQAEIGIFFGSRNCG